MNGSNISSEADKQLVEACRKGDRSAQVRLYSLYAKPMFNSAFRVLGNRQEAEEAMHDGFLTAFQKIDSFDGTSVFCHWLRKIVVNKSIDYLRKRKGLVFDEISGVLRELPDDMGEENEFMAAAPEQISMLLGTLNHHYRIVLSLHLLEGYSHEEIAKELGMTYGSVRTCYSRARKALQEKVKQHFNSILLN